MAQLSDDSGIWDQVKTSGYKYDISKFNHKALQDALDKYFANKEPDPEENSSFDEIIDKCIKLCKL